MTRRVRDVRQLPGWPRRTWRLSGEQELLVQESPIPPNLRGTVLVVPGLRGSDQGVSRVVAPLVAAGWRVVSLNLPGQGLSPVRPGQHYRLADLGDLLAEAAERIDGPKYLVGHSFGATVVAHAAAGHQIEGLAGLVLLSPVPQAAGVGADLVSRVVGAVTRLYCWKLGWLAPGAATAWCERPGRGWASNLALTRRGWRGWWQVERKSRERSLLPIDPGAVAQAQLAATFNDCGQVAVQLRAVPLGIVAGTADDLAPWSALQDLARQSRARVCCWLPGAGHLAHHEDTAAMSQSLAACLDALAGTAGPPDLPGKART